MGVRVNRRGKDRGPRHQQPSPHPVQCARRAPAQSNNVTPHPPLAEFFRNLVHSTPLGGLSGTKRFSTPPDPHQPSQQRDPGEARRVVQHPKPAAVADCHYPTCRACRLQLTRLDGEHQPLLVIDLNIEDMHVGNIEDGIGPGAPARTRTTHRVRHRRGFLSESLVASDPEGPDAFKP